MYHYTLYFWSLFTIIERLQKSKYAHCHVRSFKSGLSFPAASTSQHSRGPGHLISDCFCFTCSLRRAVCYSFTAMLFICSLCFLVFWLCFTHFYLATWIVLVPSLTLLPSTMILDTFCIVVALNCLVNSICSYICLLFCSVTYTNSLNTNLVIIMQSTIIHSLSLANYLTIQEHCKKKFYLCPCFLITV